MVFELLTQGKENARTGRELASVLGVDVRTITAQIAEERLAGQPICAATRGESKGYYLAASPEELQEYCNSLYHRGGELFKMRRALLDTLKQIRDKKEACENGRSE